MSDKSSLNLLRIRAYDEDWKEEDHPRAKNGQFTSGGAGGGAVKPVETLKGVAEAFKGADPKYKPQEVLFGKNWYIVPTKNITKEVAQKLNKDTQSSLAEVSGRFDPAKEKLGKPDPVAKGDVVMKRYPEMQKKYDQIRAKEPQITKDLSEIVKSQGGQFTGIPFRIKAAGSLERKMKDRIEDPEYLNVNTPEEAIDSLGDLVRYTVMSPSHDKLGETCNNVVDGLKKAGYHIVEVDNKWMKPKDGYHGLHLAVVTPDWSQQFELQIHSNESIDIKARQHPIYEMTRVMEDKGAPLHNELNRVMISMGDSLPIPKGIEKMQSKENKNWKNDHQEVV